MYEDRVKQLWSAIESLAGECDVLGVKLARKRAALDKRQDELHYIYFLTALGKKLDADKEAVEVVVIDRVIDPMGKIEWIAKAADDLEVEMDLRIVTQTEGESVTRYYKLVAKRKRQTSVTNCAG